MKSKDLENNSEYQIIINRLEEIQKEQEQLKIMSESHHYNAHINLPGTFEELIINLKRENDSLLEQMNFEKKRLLNSLNPEIIKNKDEILYLINSIITSIKNNNYTFGNKDNIFDSKDLQFFYDSIKYLISKLEANELLLNQIYNLQKEQENLLEKKAHYEKISLIEKITSSIRPKR